MPLSTTPWNSRALFSHARHPKHPVDLSDQGRRVGGSDAYKSRLPPDGGIINEAEKRYVRSRARTFLDDATLKDAAFLKSYAAYNATI